MSRTFIYLGNNEAREENWDNLWENNNGAPRIKVHPDLAKTLKEGQEIVEGKDFKIDYSYPMGEEYGQEEYCNVLQQMYGTMALPTEEERNESVEFAEWLLEKSENEEIIMYKGSFYWESDQEGDAPLDAKRIVELFKKRNK